VSGSSVEIIAYIAYACGCCLSREDGSTKLALVVDDVPFDGKVRMRLAEHVVAVGVDQCLS
jgi:hypothetical protein